jgi:hypothetical protein
MKTLDNVGGDWSKYNSIYFKRRDATLKEKEQNQTQREKKRNFKIGEFAVLISQRFKVADFT